MVLPLPDGSRVVLIGASRFTDPSLADLPAVRNNLDGLASCFQDPALWGLPPAHCVVVRDPVYLDDLIDPVHDAAAEAEDTLIVYYSGHGLIDHDTNELLLALVNSKPGRSHKSVPYEYVRRDVSRARAKRRVVILDCCYSGKALGGMSDASSVVADQASADGTYLLASAPPNQQALSPPGEHYTAFTGELVSLLRGGLADAGPELSLDTVYKHIYFALRDRSRPEPQRRAGNTAGDLALARNRRWAVLPEQVAEANLDRLQSRPWEPQQKTEPLFNVPASPREVRERIKKLLRDSLGVRQYAYSCPVCGVTVAGRNLVQHIDKHDPAELSTLDPDTLTLAKKPVPELWEDPASLWERELTKRENQPEPAPLAESHSLLALRIRDMVRAMGSSGTYLCPLCQLAMPGEHLGDHFEKHSPAETRSLDHSRISVERVQ